MLIPGLCPWAERWGAAFDVNAENVFHQCKPSSCLENVFHWFDCLLSNSVSWQPKRYVGIHTDAASLWRLPHDPFSGSKIILLFVTIWSSSTWLLDSRYSRSLRPAKVICQICIFFLIQPCDYFTLEKKLCKWQPGRLEIVFQRSRGVIEFVVTFIEVRKTRVLRQAIIAFAGRVTEEYVFHVCVFTFAFLEGVAVSSLQLVFSRHKPCLSKDVNF